MSENKKGRSRAGKSGSRGRTGDDGTEPREKEESGGSEPRGKAGDSKPDDVSLVLSPAVVSDIVRREALNAPGVTEIASSSFIGRSKGISVSEETDPDDGVLYRVEAHVYVEFGTNCTKLRDALARRINSSVKKMTGRDVASLIIHVEGVRDPVPDEDVQESPDTPMIDY